MVEYGLLVSLIAIMVVVAVSFMSGAIQNIFYAVWLALTSL